MEDPRRIFLLGPLSNNSLRSGVLAANLSQAVRAVPLATPHGFRRDGRLISKARW